MKKVLNILIPILFVALLVTALIFAYSKRADLEKYFLGGDEKIEYTITEPQENQNILTITDGTNEVVQLKVKIAADSLTKETGFMFVDHLDEDKGMFFVYKADVSYGFWMKNCLIALDMIFVDADMNVVSVINNAPACKTASCTIYHADQPYRYVLEINGGIAEKLGIKKGQKVSVEGIEGYL
jgi:uncharacterized membrane protein (UPF0127 family)